MTERLLTVLIGLQRSFEDARIKGDDIGEVQKRRIRNIVSINRLLTGVQKLHSELTIAAAFRVGPERSTGSPQSQQAARRTSATEPIDPGNRNTGVHTERTKGMTTAWVVVQWRTVSVQYQMCTSEHQEMYKEEVEIS